MKEVSSDKTQRVKGTQYDPLYLLSTKKKQGEHGSVQHVQGTHFQRNVLRVFVTLSGPVGNPESSTAVRRRSPKSITQSPNSKFLGLSLSIRVCSLSIIPSFIIRFLLYSCSYLVFIGENAKTKALCLVDIAANTRNVCEIYFSYLELCH